MDSRISAAGAPAGTTQTGAATFQDAGLPGPFHEADDAAQRAQRGYVTLTLWNLGLLVVSAATFVYELPTEGARKAFAFLRAALLFFSFVLTLVLDGRKPDRAWRQTRYCAEQVKSLAWRYMTHTLPAATDRETSAGPDPDSGLDPDDQLFLSNLRALLRSDDLPTDVFRQPGGHQAITEDMRRVRAGSLEDQYKAYIDCRIEPQRAWYAAKQQTILRRERAWFSVMMACQILAVVSAFLKGTYMSLPLDISGFLATLAAAVLAWIQVRQYQRLSRAYGVAASDLLFLQSLHKGVRSEDGLRRLVTEGEQIIGDEYSEWRHRQEAA